MVDETPTLDTSKPVETLFVKTDNSIAMDKPNLVGKLDNSLADLNQNKLEKFIETADDLLEFFTANIGRKVVDLHEYVDENANDNIIYRKAVMMGKRLIEEPVYFTYVYGDRVNIASKYNIGPDGIIVRKIDDVTRKVAERLYILKQHDLNAWKNLTDLKKIDEWYSYAEEFIKEIDDMRKQALIRMS